MFYLIFALLPNLISSQQTTTIHTKCGDIIGERSNNIDSFVGIPYAIPPLKQHRWRPTLPALCTSTTFDASKSPGPACYQKPNKLLPLTMSEDCLHINVYKPSSFSSKSDVLLPVAVYLHGGSLVEGSAMAIQAGFGGPITLANRTNSSVISVSLNYRLGVLGFLALKGLTGNYGLLDVIEALKWIATHIESFGGDPNKVTVYGQSSGGSLVFALMTSPLATDLFQRAISMSGSPRLNSTITEASEYWHPQIFEKTCQFNKTVACLSILSPETLVAAQPNNWDPSEGWSSHVFWDSYQYAPLLVIDGHVLPFEYRHPKKKKKKNSILLQRMTPLDKQVPLIIGVTREEIDFAPGNDVRNLSFSNVASLFKTAITNSTHSKSFVKEILNSYQLSTDKKMTPVQGLNATSELVFSDFISDATMLCGTYVLANAWSLINPNIYMYTVSERPGNPFCVLGAFSHIKK